MKKDTLNRFFSAITSISLLANSLVYPFAIAYAQEATPSAEPTLIVESTPTASPEESPVLTSTTEPTQESTPTPVIDVTTSPEVVVSSIPVAEVISEPTLEAIPTAQPEDQSTTTVPPDVSGESTEVSPTPTITTVTEEKGEISAYILNNTSASSIDEFDLLYQSEGSATISTDKLDYAPTDTVFIMGSGFITGKTYTIIISSSDYPAVTHEGTLTADSEGNITYSYQLDGEYRPNYKVEVKYESIVVASTTFTDDIDVVTNSATGITLTDATLNGQNGGSDAAGHSFWVSLDTFSTASSTIPADVYSTVDLGAIAANTAFSAPLTSVMGLPAVTPNTTYYFTAWSLVGGTWYPGEILTFTTEPGSVYIDTNENSALNSGEQSFNIIQDAINAAVSGETIVVTAGTYNLTSRIDVNKAVSILGDTTTPANVVINAPIAGGTMHGQNSVFMITSSGVTIRGFKIQGALHTGAAQNAGVYVDDPRQTAPYFNPGLSNITISNNEVTDNGYGIFVHNIKDSTISNNKVYSNKSTATAGKEYDAGTGIVVYGRAEDSNHTNNLTINNNDVYSNETDGIRVDVSSSVGASDWINDLAITISNNTVYDNGRTILGVDKYIGIKSSGMSRGVTLSGNKIYSHTMSAVPSATNQSTGIWIAASNSWEINNNNIHDNTNGIYFLASTAVAGSGSHTIINNDIHANVRGISIDDGSEAVANDKNSIYSNNITTFSGVPFLPYDVYNRGTTNFDAKENYWGSAVKATIQSKISSNVAFDPYYVNSERTILSSVVPTTVYVDGTYVDGSAGVHIFGYDAFAKIQDAISGVAAGGTVNVASGTYAEHVTLSKSLSLIGADKTTTIIDGTGSGVVLTITSSDVLFKDFTVKNSGTDINANAGIVLVGVGNCTVENNIITNNVTGVAVMSSSGNNIKDNTISNSARYGIVLEAHPAYPTTYSTSNTISGNTMVANARDGIYAGENCDGNSITDNSISGAIGTTEGSSFEGNGIYLWKSAGNTVTENTIFSNAIGYGIEMYGSKNNTITGNDITGNLDGFQIRNINEAEYPGYSIRGNTISGNKIYDNTRVNLYGSPNFDFNIEKNWWGSTDETTIVNKLASWDSSGNVVPGTTVFLDYTPWCMNSECTIFSSANAITVAATGMTSTDATLNGINGSYDADNTSFWWGTTSEGPFTACTSCNSQFPSGWVKDTGLGSKTVGGSFSEALTGLASGTQYYFLAWSEVGGTWYPGDVLTFTTDSPDTTPPATPTDLHILDYLGNNLSCGGYTNNRYRTVDWNDNTETDFDHYDFQNQTGTTTASPIISERSGNMADADGYYKFRVRAVDNVSNASAWTDWCGVTLDRIAPSTPVINSGPSEGLVSNNNSPAFGFTIDSNATAKCKLDPVQADFLDCDSLNTQSYVGLSEGPYTFNLKTVDAAGNESTTITRSFTIDYIAPTVPTNGSPNSITIDTNNFDFNWDNSTDDYSPITYKYQTSQDSTNSGGILTNGLWTSGTLTTSMIRSSGAGDGTWYWQVKAIDAAGNESAWSTIWNVTIDTTAPGIPGTPSTTSPTNSPTQTWTWTAAVEAVSGIQTYFYRITGDTIVALTSTGSNVASFVTNLGQGIYNFFVTAQDNAGNIGSESAAGSVTVDNIAPTVVLTDNHSDSIVRNANTVVITATFTDADQIDEITPPTISINSVGIVDNAVMTKVSNLVWTYSWNVPAGNDGFHTVSIRAKDRVGNTNDPATGQTSYTIDNTVPSTPSITTPVANGYITSATTQTFAWTTSTDSGSGLATTDTYQYQIDDNNDFSSTLRNVSQIGTTKTLTSSLSDGSYYIRVRAKDVAGNYSAWSTVVLFTVDTTVPSASWVSPAEGSVVSGTTNVEVTALDNDATGIKDVKFEFKKNIEGAEWQEIVTDSENPYKTDWDTTSLSLDAYTLKATVTDNAENVTIIERIVNIAAVVSNEESDSASYSNALITWITDRLTQSRVIYDTISHPILGIAPNYGYTWSTGTSNTSPKVFSHSVTITGLSDGTIYYYRTISEGSPIAIGNERSFKTLSIPGAPAPSDSGGVLGASIASVAVAPWTSWGTDLIAVGSREEIKGEVLPASTEAPQTLGEKSTNILQDISQFAKDRTKITIGIGLGILLVIGLIVYISKKKDN